MHLGKVVKVIEVITRLIVICDCIFSW